MHPNVHSSIIYNYQDMKTTSLSINQKMDKNDVIHTHTHTHTHAHAHTHAHMHNGILLRHKKIKSADGIMLSEVSQIEKCYIISLMKNLKIK